MKDLELLELQNGLAELVRGDRKSALAQTKASAIYLPTLAALLARVDALPSELLKLPRVALLQLADGRRDGLARAAWHLSQAVLAHPDLGPDLDAAASVCSEHFVPTLAITRDTYAEAAHKGATHKASLEAHRATLAAVHTPEGRTLADWIADFAAAGEEVGAIHRGRSDDLATAGNRDGAGALRSEIIGALGELRSVVQRELAHDPTLPRTIEAAIFGYLDEMQRLAAQRKASPPPRPASPAPTP